MVSSSVSCSEGCRSIRHFAPIKKSRTPQTPLCPYALAFYGHIPTLLIEQPARIDLFVYLFAGSQTFTYVKSARIDLFAGSQTALADLATAGISDRKCPLARRPCYRRHMLRQVGYSILSFAPFASSVVAAKWTCGSKVCERK